MIASLSLGVAAIPLVFWPTPRRGSSRDLGSLQTGFTVNTIHVGSWDRPDVMRMLAELSPQLLRFPGGTDGSYWDWRRGWFFDHLPASADPAIAAQAGRTPSDGPTRLENMAPALRATGASPIFVLNLYTATIADELAMLRHAQALGMHLPEVELGNEFYWARYADRFPSGYDYARRCIGWTAQIKRAFPQTRVGLVVPAIDEQQDGIGPARLASVWNQGVVRAWREHREGFPDAAIIHPYTFPGGLRYAQLLKAGRLDAADFRAVLASAFLSARKVDATMRHLPPGLHAWVTEYSMMDRGVGGKGPTLVEGEWVQALYTATETLNLLMDPQVEILIYTEIGGPPNFTTHSQAAFGFAYQRRFGRLPPAPYSLTGPGLVMKDINAAKKGMRRARALSFDSAGRLSADVGVPVTFPALLAVAFDDGSRCRAVVLNLGDRSASVSRAALAPAPGPDFREGAVECDSAAPGQAVLDLASDVSTAKSRLRDEIELPPYSFTYVH